MVMAQRVTTNGDGAWVMARRDITTTTMVMGDDNNDNNGDGATGDKVDNDGDGATRDNYDDDDDDDNDDNGDGWRVVGGSSLHNTVEVFTNKKSRLR